ncbi:tripartite tricarboxylate transporter substrate binding protein [Bordetella petrii]|uniref:tripartite tricarboxylate transporter substrate binding protein n=1 Tax=Bordetella petrii TaxID=94624 RepID=UPI001E3CD7B6|nr:tripartite tricarboxylate transporter substrate binding protein [Bordetella petrii]MCD0501451.1 tripartite tricarboxylate transporter substrate binding protein [Bordetella petrii]
MPQPDLISSPRRAVAALVFAALCAAGMAGTQARADTYPSRPIRVIVPYAPGGPSDLIVRTAGKLMEKELGQPVVVENRPGANGTLGAVEMKNAKPDGYHLAIVPVGIFRQPFIQRTAFDPLRDLTYISALVDYSYMIAVRADAKWQTINEFVNDAKSHPGQYSYGTPGAFSTPHLSMDKLGSLAGIEWTHVPYKSASEIVSALLGKQVDIVAGTGSSTLDQYLKTGQLRVLAAIADERSASHPDWPTLKEQGYAVVAKAPFGLVGPASMPADRVRKIAALFEQIMGDPAFREVAAQNAIELNYLGPADYTEYARRTYAEEAERMPRLLQAMQH